MSSLPAIGRILRRRRPAGPEGLGQRDPGTHRPDDPAVHRGAAPVALPPRSDRFDGAFAIVRDAVDAGQLPTAVLAIRHGREPVVLELMTRPRGDRLARDSIYFLASVTKPVMALAVMLLVEDGAVDLDRPLVRDLPGFAGAERATITPRHILSHTAGIDDDATGSLTRARPSFRQLLDLASRTPLQFPPGTRFEYSSVSYFLMGELVTRRSGTPYPTFIRERIFEPLGMTETTFDPRPLGRNRLMPVHGAALDSWWKKRIALGYLASIAHPGGGLWGTVDDLLRFGDAMLDAWHGRPGAIITRTSMHELTRLQTAAAAALVDGVERPANHALGWWKPGYGTTVPGASTDAFEHGGASGTRLFVDPRHDLVVVYLSNEWKQSPDIACWPALRAVYRALDPETQERPANLV